MKNNNHKLAICEVCKKEFATKKLFPIKLMRNSVLDTFHAKHPDANMDGHICFPDLRDIRAEHIEHLMIQDRGALSKLDKQVLESLSTQEILAENVNKKFDKDLTFGERMADRVARFGGSWVFILSFFLVLISWMAINTFFFAEKKGFDPYPYIFLNLILSCLAAIQAPVIMMSQNRQAEKERLRANEDYCTNLKAELEIQQLHSKIDLFMKQQWESLIELQKIQIDLTEDLIHHKKQCQRKTKMS